MGILEIILVIVLPPLAVLLRFGLTGKFWVNLLLTILGYIPGLIHGVYVMAQDDARRHP
ncbi:MAG: YqaE/Pmp3 family membrane protein [Bacteroidota bacterium]